MNRRDLLKAGLVGALAAPAIIRPASALLRVNQLNGFGRRGGGVPTGTFQGSAVDAVDRTTYTFSSQPLGSGTRKIVVAAAANGAGKKDVASVTVDGNSMSEAIDAVAGTNGDLSLWYFDATSSTGSTGDVVVTFNSSASNCGIAIWTIDGAASGAPSDTGSDDQQSTTDTVSTTVDVPANGAVIAAISHGNGVASTLQATWTGVTEDYDEVVDSGGARHSGGHENYAAAQTGLTVSAVLDNANNRIHLAVAVWGP